MRGLGQPHHAGRRAWLLPIVVLLVVAVAHWRAFHLTAATEDEGLLLVYPAQILHGRLPYRDFMTAYGPLSLYLLAPLYDAFGVSVVVERLLGLAVHLALVGGLFALFLPEGAAVAATAALVAGLLLVPLGLAAYAYLLSLALVVIGLALVTQRGGRRAALLGGVLSGLAVSARPDAALLASIPALLALRGSGRIGTWVRGAVIGLLPLAIHLIVTPGPLSRDLLDRALRGAAESRLPIPPHIADDSRLLAVVLLAVIIALVAAVFAGRRSTSMAVFALVLLTVPQVLQRADSAHALFSGVIAVPAAIVGVVQVSRRLGAGAAGQAVAAGLVAVLPLAANPASVAWPIAKAISAPADTDPVVHHDGRSLPVNNATQARDLRALLASVDDHASPGDSVFVFYSDLERPLYVTTALYHLLPRLRVTAYNLEVTPGVTNRPAAHVDRDLSHTDLLILEDGGRDRWTQLFPFSKRGWSRPQEIVDRDFRQVGSFGLYRLLVRSQPASQGRSNG